MTDTLQLVFAVDAAYEGPLRVLWTSLFAQHPDRALALHVLHDGLPPAHQESLRRFAERHRARAYCHAIDPTWLRGFAGNDAFPSTAQFHRLFVDAVLPAEIDRVLYLDVDTLVCSDLAPLYDTDLEGAIIAAVEDLDAHSSAVRLGLPSGAPYFNSGVLLIDRRRWSQFGVADRVREYLHLHAAAPDRWLYPDQDALNVVLADRWRALPPRWNVYACYRLHRPVDLSEERRSALRDPGIIHFTGPEKPWLRHCAPPYRAWYAARRREAGVPLRSGSSWGSIVRRWQQEHELRRMRALHRKAGLGNDF